MDGEGKKTADDRSDIVVGSEQGLRARRFDEPEAENVVRLGANRPGDKAKQQKDAPLDIDWFYEDEEFFTEWMDSFDW